MSKLREPEDIVSGRENISSAGEQRHGDEVELDAREAAYDVCKRLVSEVDPQYRKRYFSRDISHGTRERTKLMQQVVLCLLSSGPTRNCIEERARLRAFEKKGEAFDNKRENESGDPLYRKRNPFLNEVCELFDTANDDDAFAFLCLLFDKNIEDRFDMVAAPFMEMYRSGYPDMSNIMRDVMVHAHWKLYGIQNPTEHEKRESSLMCVSDVVVKARGAYGLDSYSEMQRRFN